MYQKADQNSLSKPKYDTQHLRKEFDIGHVLYCVSALPKLIGINTFDFNT